MAGIKVLYIDENIIVIDKPCGVPSQSDPSGDKDAMTLAGEYLAEIGEKNDLWLVHRLDRTVGGILVFARNKKSAAYISEKIANGGFNKKYLAVAHGSVVGGELIDYIYKDSALSKAFVVKTLRRGAKEARLICDPIKESDGMTLIRVKLLSGRFHQIRVQLASRAHPLIGDKKYGSKDAIRRTPCLYSSNVSFDLFGKTIDITSLPDRNEYPWSKFDLSDAL